MERNQECQVVSKKWRIEEPLANWKVVLTSIGNASQEQESVERRTIARMESKSSSKSSLFWGLMFATLFLMAFLQMRSKQDNALVLRGTSIATSNQPTQEETTSLFANFVQEHNRIYAHQEEYNRRQAIFHGSLSTIRSHNANANNTWTMEVNMFADRSPDELPLGLDKIALRSGRGSRSKNTHKITTTSLYFPLPDSVDWRKKGITTPVKNQGHCGSCWAFASTAALESHIALQTGKLFELSVQELVTCAPNTNHCGGTGGCNGNTAELAYDFVSSGRGMVTEWQWAYTSGTNHTAPACDNIPTDNATISGAVASIEGYVGLEHNDYMGLLQAVATVGPVVVNVDASNWCLYQGGIFDESQFSNATTRDINHVVVVEGYGTDESTGQDYWLVRNSWGPLWGEDGYIRLKRESNAATNDCKPDITPADGIACVGPDDSIDPPVVDVCGTSGVLYDALYPIGGHLLQEEIFVRVSGC